MRKLIFVVLLLASALIAQTALPKPGSAPPFGDIDFLLGDWTGTGGGQPGQATAGEASFHLELNGQILVRRSFSEYGKERHDDLLIVYRDQPSAAPRAIYFDSEGHTIHYSITTATVGGHKSVTFDSDPSQPGPRFRLSYVQTDKGVNGKFEMLMPGATEYKTYLAWTSVKK
jgi:hypothetical protein